MARKPSYGCPPSRGRINPFDRILTAGVAHGFGGLIVGAEWWALAMLASGGLVATLGHGSWFTMGRNGLTGPERGSWARPIFDRFCLMRPTHWSQPAPWWWDYLGMTIVGVTFVLPTAILMAVAGVAAWWWLLPATLWPGLAYTIGWWADGRGWRPLNFGATRLGAALHGAGYGVAYLLIALFG